MELHTPPAAGSRSSDLVGKALVITEVKGSRVVETSLGEATAVVLDVLVLAGFPGEQDLTHVPDVLIFWSVVQRQLLSDDFQVPTAGRFVQRGKAYVLEALEGEELAVIQSLI